MALTEIAVCGGVFRAPREFQPWAGYTLPAPPAWGSSLGRVDFAWLVARGDDAIEYDRAPCLTPASCVPAEEGGKSFFLHGAVPLRAGVRRIELRVGEAALHQWPVRDRPPEIVDARATIESDAIRIDYRLGGAPDGEELRFQVTLGEERPSWLEWRPASAAGSFSRAVPRSADAEGKELQLWVTDGARSTVTRLVIRRG